MQKKKKDEELDKLKEFVKKEIKQEVDHRTTQLLQKREAKVTAIKVLRKFTEFSKDNFEDIVKENFELKKRVIESDTHNKILKVTLAKVKAAHSLKAPQKPKVVLPANNSHQASVLSWKKPKSMVSSTASTATGDSEGLKMELLKLKKEWSEKEHNYKIQLGRMKTFYDKHLGELNHLKQTLAKQPPSNPTHKTKGAPTTTTTTTTVEQKNILTDKPACCELHPQPTAPTATEETIRVLRNKLLQADEHKKGLETKITTLEDQVTVLRGRVQGQGVVKMRAVAEQLTAELAKEKETIKKLEARIQEVDSLDHQLATKHPEEGTRITRLVNFYLSLRASMQRQPEEIWYDTKNWVSSWFEGMVVSPTMRLLHAVWVIIRDKILTHGVDQKAILETQIKEWMARPELSAQSLKDLRFQLNKLQEEMQVVQKQNEQYRIKLQAVSSLGAESHAVTGDDETFGRFVVDVRKLQEELDKEEAMPEHLKKRVTVWNDQWFSTKIKLNKTEVDLKAAKQTIKSLEGQLATLAATLQKKSSKKIELVPSSLLKPTSSSANRGTVLIKTVKTPPMTKPPK